MSGKRVFVTGGAGFIGSHLVHHHLEKGDQVWVVDNLQTGRIENIKDCQKNTDFRFDEADLRTWKELNEAVAWATHIYHMIADVGQKYVITHPVDTLSNNIESFERVLLAMCAVGSNARILLASTSEIYGHSNISNDGTIDEHAIVSFPSGEFLQQTYPISKLVNEIMALSYVHEKKLNCVIARIFNTIGLNQTSTYGMVFPNFIEEALTGRPITVYGDGSQSRSFCNVHDTVRALSMIIDHPDCVGQIINVGCDRETSILDLAHLVKKLTNSDSPIEFIPYEKAYGCDFVDIMRRRPNLEKIKRLTGYQPRWTLEKTIEEVAKVTKSKLVAHHHA
jgi:UDP-glucose 4-epimerase